MKIHNSVALVTGANRGFGKALVRALLDGGARKVYAAARNPAGIDLKGVHPIRLDVTNAEDIAAAARDIGDIDILINNAGVIKGGLFLSEGGREAARLEMETNYFAPMALSQAFAPALARNGGGAIINVLSVLSWIAFPGVATYSASKAAAWSLSNGLRSALRGQGTQVLSLHVGYMDTDMASHVQSQKSDPYEVARGTLAALEAGKDEFLADELSRNVKSGLAKERGIYLE
jgi:NAD(P)-dependent dehydrogenase (short-subunit alcohol dehydrogenase family)